MSKVLVTESSLEAIGDAIRAKNGTGTQYSPAEMAPAIRNIPSYPEPSGSTQINYNGTYDVKNRASAIVNVPNRYTFGDEGKVVNNGALVSQSDRRITGNGTYNTKLNKQVIVDVAGGGTLKSKTITQNGDYDPSDDEADGYNAVHVNVPNTYTASDEGKVVDDGVLVAQTSTNITTNGTHDTTTNNEVVVNVPNSYSAGDEGKVVSNGALAAQSSTTKTANGTYNTTENNEVVINVPNSYTQADEGKVVSSGALVAQTSATKTENGTYDTTLNNHVIVAIPVALGEVF